MDAEPLRALLDSIKAVPSDRLWFDPAMLTNATFPQLSQVQLPVSGNFVVAPANARRWGIGFVIAAGVASIPFAPWPDVDGFPFGSTPTVKGVLWFNLFSHGPLVCNQWSAGSGASAVVRVVELIRR